METRGLPLRALGLSLTLAVTPPGAARAQIIDFETLPGGALTADEQLISNEYASLGVTFTLLDPVTELPIGFPRIAKAGSPQTAFQGCAAPDTPLPGLYLGTSFLTDGVAVGLEGFVRVEYAFPVAQASGVIIDIDCRVDGGEPCEQWTVSAYDSVGAEIQTVVIDGPEGAPNPQCEFPDAGPGDSNAFGWIVDVGANEIASIILRYTGEPTNVGLAFDNFSVSSLPVPPSVTASAAADPICLGESVPLLTEVSGGLPPYTYLWQHEVAPAVWSDVGTGSPHVVHPLEASVYRVVVTDALADEATSAPLTVGVTSTDPMCASSLLVGSDRNDAVVRIGFLSSLVTALVTPASGSLDGPAKIVIGADDYLYVASYQNDRVLRYHAVTGAFVDVFVAHGSGGLNGPTGLDFGPDGDLYVASLTHEVLRYDGGTGAFVGVFVPWGSGLNTPTGLLFGPDDNLYVCSRNSDKVLRFDGSTGAPLGDFVTSGSGGLDRPRGLTFGPDGHLYLAEETNDSVRRYDGTSGVFLDVFVAPGSGGLDRADDVAFGPGGDLWVTSHENDQVIRYDGDTGAPLGGVTDALLDGPAWFAVSGVPMATAVPAGSARPLALVLEPNVPNPFGDRTTIGFTLPRDAPALVSVHDVAGRRVATLLDRALPAGRHAVHWSGVTRDGRLAPAGVYFLRVESEGRRECLRMVLVR